MAAPSYTYTLANSTTADADEVMQNFNDILNGVSDGTKDLSINALTVAGAASFNGNVTLGNASGDTITPTGRFAADIVPSANAARNLGSSSLAYAGLYLDNDATDGGAVYFDASSSKFMKSNAAGTEVDLSGFDNINLNGEIFADGTSIAVSTTTVSISNSGSQNIDATLECWKIGRLVSLTWRSISHDSAVSATSGTVIPSAYWPDVTIYQTFFTSDSQIDMLAIQSNGTFSIFHYNSGHSATSKTSIPGGGMTITFVQAP